MFLFEAIRSRVALRVPSGPTTRDEAWSSALMILSSGAVLNNNSIVQQTHTQQVLELRDNFDFDAWLSHVHFVFATKDAFLWGRASKHPDLSDVFPWDEADVDTVSYWRSLLFLIQAEGSVAPFWVSHVAPMLLRPFDELAWHTPSKGIPMDRALRELRASVLPQSPVLPIVVKLVKSALGLVQASGVVPFPRHAYTFWMDTARGVENARRLTPYEDNNFPDLAETLAVRFGDDWPSGRNWSAFVDELDTTLRRSVQSWQVTTGANAVVANLIASASTDGRVLSPLDRAREIQSNDVVQYVGKEMGVTPTFDPRKDDQSEIIDQVTWVEAGFSAARRTRARLPWIDAIATRSEQKWRDVATRLLKHVQELGWAGEDRPFQRIATPSSVSEFETSPGTINFILRKTGRFGFRQTRVCVVFVDDNHTAQLACPGLTETPSFTSEVRSALPAVERVNYWDPSVKFHAEAQTQEFVDRYNAIISVWMMEMLFAGYTQDEITKWPLAFSTVSNASTMFNYVAGEYVEDRPAVFPTTT